MAVYNRIFGSSTDTFATATSATYSASRNFTAATSGNAASVNDSAVANSFATPNYVCSQAFLVFDTSAVPAGTGSGFFSVVEGGQINNVNSDTFRVRDTSSISNKIAGGSLAALTLRCDPGTWPVSPGARFSVPILNVNTIPRSATYSVVFHAVGEENGTVPTGLNRFALNYADQTGTTSDPYLQLNSGLLWEFVGVSNVVEVTATPHALVTTGISGTLQAGDLLVACISSRIASTTSVTLPTGGEWTLVSEQKNNNVLSTTSAAASGLMAYCVRGASNPNLTFTHPVAPSVAIGRIVAYRNVNTTSPKDTQTSFTTAIAISAVSGPGLTTSQTDDLIVAMAAGGQEATWSAFNATDPAGVSGATVTTAPVTTWSERADSATTTGVDTSLAIFDAVKMTAGATGNLTATAFLAAAQVVIAGAFKIAVAAPPPVTGTGTPAAQAGDTDGAGISSSDGTGAPAAETAAVSGTGTVDSAAATGTGALAAQDSAVSGAGVSGSVAIGALGAQGDSYWRGRSASVDGLAGFGSVGFDRHGRPGSDFAGKGKSNSIGAGSLVAGSAELAGTGIAAAGNSGALVAQAATASGAGTVDAIGTGSIAAGSAEIIGTGTIAAGNSGALIGQAATVAGLGVSESISTGALQTGAATVAGTGLGDSIGIGTLVDGSATVVGEGVVLEESAVIGTGALVAGVATVSGEGEVSGEVAPPVFIGGGRYRPERPFLVEGIGYGILPQLEGEAYGLVVVTGVGVGNAPRLIGVGTGTVGVAGRSAARLGIIKVAAVGDRGQVGTGAGSVVGIKGAAMGRHDDDGAAIVAFLLAA